MYAVEGWDYWLLRWGMLCETETKVGRAWVRLVIVFDILEQTCCSS